MIICPNKTTPQWKNLVKEIKDKLNKTDDESEKLAMLAFIRHGDIPDGETGLLLLQKQNAGLFNSLKDAFYAKDDIRKALEESIYNIDNTLSEKEQLAIEDLLTRKAEQLENKRHLKSVMSMLEQGRTEEQLLDVLDRKGVPRYNAWAIIGNAKESLVESQKSPELISEAVNRFFKTINNIFLGRKNELHVQASIVAKGQQESIKKVSKDRSHLQEAITNEQDPVMKERLRNAYNAAKDWTNVDKAIHIYLDTQRNPEHFDKYYDKLSKEQKAIADLSQNLSPKQLRIAEEIQNEYKELGKLAVENKIIGEALDNYVARAWDFGKKTSTEQAFKFSTSTRHSLERSLDTIIQGQAEGNKLKIEGATNNLQIIKEELGNVIASKKLIEAGFKEKVDTGLKDEEGNPIVQSLFSTTKLDGYEIINNPFFKKTELVGTAENVKLFNAKNSFEIDGNIYEKKEIYAPAAVAKSMNNILGKSTLKYVDKITMLNRIAKKSILAFSPFHPITFTFQHLLSAKSTKGDNVWEMRGINPITAYKKGLKTLNEYSPEVARLLNSGLTIGTRQENIETEKDSRINEFAKKFKVTKAIAKMGESYHRWIFETYGAGLKTFDGINLLRSEVSKKSIELGRPLTESEHNAISDNVAKLMNDTYGGENWDRMHGSFLQDPNARHALSLAMLAPDWTISNLRLLNNSFKGNEGKIYRNMWFRVITRGVASTVIMNAAMTFMDEKDEHGNPLPYWDAFEKRYKEAWTQGHLRWLMVDMTPLYHSSPNHDPKQRMYMSVLGAYTDPIKLVSNPFDYMMSKGSPTVKIGMEYLTGENWQHKTFTDFDELSGLDENGVYQRDVKDKKTGEIKHREGDKKGGQLKGELLKYSFKPHGSVTTSQLPSFTLSQVRGMMPTGIQSLAQGATGESDWAKTLFMASGTRMTFGKKGAEDENTLLNWGRKLGKATGLLDKKKKPEKESTKAEKTMY